MLKYNPRGIFYAVFPSRDPNHKLEALLARSIYGIPSLTSTPVEILPSTVSQSRTSQCLRGARFDGSTP